MNVKAVVKVMNFHALLRVESSRRKAELLQTMETELENMMRVITNNKNLRLDKRIGSPDKSKPVLRIYLGSDFGFCGSVNSSVNRVLHADGKVPGKVVIGKKLSRTPPQEVHITAEEFYGDFSAVRHYLEQAVYNGDWSAVELVYNHYYNLSSIRQEVERIYPLEPDDKSSRSEYEDFTIEDDAGTLLEDMILSYLCYEVKIAAASSYAAENTMRQNSTTESLKKLDEREAEERRLERKEHTAKSFRKTIDSYVKQKALNT